MPPEPSITATEHTPLGGMKAGISVRRTVSLTRRRSAWPVAGPPPRIIPDTPQHQLPCAGPFAWPLSVHCTAWIVERQEEHKKQTTPEQTNGAFFCMRALVCGAIAAARVENRRFIGGDRTGRKRSAACPWVWCSARASGDSPRTREEPKIAKGQEGGREPIIYGRESKIRDPKSKMALTCAGTSHPEWPALTAHISLLTSHFAAAGRVLAAGCDSG